MDTLDLDLLAKWSGGVWTGGKPTAAIGFSNDTRSLKPGEVFVALSTARRDGHDFLAEAERAGAAAALTRRRVGGTRLPQLVVADPQKALVEMAGQYRQTWQAQVVGITGSCGKTTCKDLLTAILGSEQCLSTQGNLNNLIGAPMSMLRPKAAVARYAALEAGISEPGEMEALARTIDPDWVVVTAIGPAHLEGLGSEEGVAKEKGLLAQGERVRSVFAGPSCATFVEQLGGRRVSLVKPDPRLGDTWTYRFSEKKGSTEMELRLPRSVERLRYRGFGDGLACDVALAACVAFSLEVPADRLREGLDRWRPGPLRGEWRSLPAGRAFVDCYNANPLSMRDALRSFAAGSDDDRDRLYVIGCMGELGAEAASYHEALGKEISLRPQDLLLVIGEHASSVLRGMRKLGHRMERCIEIGSASEAQERVANFEGDVFLKGSRRYRLEAALPPSDRQPSAEASQASEGREGC